MREAAAAADWRTQITHDLAFHRTMVELAGNEPLLQSWLVLGVEVSTAFATYRTLWDQAELAEFHVPIVEAIRAGDARRAGGRRASTSGGPSGSSGSGRETPRSSAGVKRRAELEPDARTATARTSSERLLPVEPRSPLRGGARMKLGLLTAPFPRRSLAQVAAWAAGEGFEMLEVACWPAAGGERRRYAGTSHIDVTKRRSGQGPRRSTRTASRSRRSPTTRTTSTRTRRSGRPRTRTCAR